MSTTITQHIEKPTWFAKWFPLIILLAAQFSTMADNSGIAIATESLIVQYGATMAEIQVANAIYPLIAGAGMIAGGLFGLIIGWKRQMIIGAGLLSLASFSAAYAPNMDVLNYGARVAAGASACLLIPAMLANIAGLYKGRDQAIAFSCVAALVGLSSAASPLIFGVIFDLYSFKVGFIGLGVYCLILMGSCTLLPQLKREPFEGKLDIVGMIIAALGLLCLVNGLLNISSWGLVKPFTDFSIFGLSPALPLAFTGVVILFVLLKWEKNFEEKGGTPLLPSTYLTNKQVVVGLVFSGAYLLTFATVSFVNISYMQLVANMSATTSAWALAAFSIGMVVGSLIAPAKLHHLSCQRVGQIGFITLAISGAMMFPSFEIDAINWIQYLALLIFGLGAGLLASQASILVTSALSDRDAQQSGGIQATSRNVGQALGVAILGSIMLFSLTGDIKQQVATSDQLSSHTKVIFEQQPVIPFVSNKGARALMDGIINDKQEVELIIEVMAEARLNSVYKTLAALLALCLAGLGVCTQLPKHSLMAKSDPN